MDFKKLKAIAFDLDGTLYSSEMLIAKSYTSSLHDLKEKFNLSFTIPHTSDIIKLIGLPGLLLFKALIPSELEDYYTEFQAINGPKINEAVKNRKGELMEGVPELFNYLHNKQITSCMASNGSMRYLNNIIDTYHLKFFNPIIALNYDNIQTKSDILKEYLTVLQIHPSEIVMIGDRYIDLEAAHANNIFFIGLKSGIGYTIDPQELKDADLLLDNITALHQFLKDHMDA